eukprot:2185265-Rhodomonas_salina.1
MSTPANETRRRHSNLSPCRERLKHTNTHTREVKSWGQVLYVACKVLAFSRDGRSVGSVQGSKSSKNLYLRD